MSTTPRREEIILLAAKIPALREAAAKAQAELAEAEAALDGLIGVIVPSPLTPNAGESLLAGIESPEDRSMNQQINDIIDMLDLSQDLDADQIIEKLPAGSNITSVRSALARLAELKKIRRTTRGRYGKLLPAEVAA